MATGLASWSTTAANNATADSNVNWAEGMAPSAVNNSARAQMASAAMYRDDIEGSLTTGGTATQFTLTTTQSFASLSALDGNMLAAKFHLANGASATLNVDGLGAKSLQTAVGTNVGGGAIPANSVQRVTYDNSNNCFLLHDSRSGAVNLPDLNISGANSVSTPAADDLLVLFDSSAASNLNITVNNFFRAINVLTAETAVQSNDALAIYDMSASTGDKASITDFLAVMHTLASVTTPESTDELLTYDASGSTANRMILSDAFKVINALAADTALASTDEIPVYDLSASTADKATVANFFKALNTLDSVGSLESTNDFLLVYDSSAAAARKIAQTNIITPALGASGIVVSTQSVSAVSSVIFTGLDSTFNSYKLFISNLKSDTDTVFVNMRAGIGAGPTWQSTLTSYAWTQIFNTITASGHNQDSTDSVISINGDVSGAQLGNATGEHMSGEVNFGNVGTDDFQLFDWNLRWNRADTGQIMSNMGAARLVSPVGSVSAISLFLSAGSVSGRFTLVGLKHA